MKKLLLLLLLTLGGSVSAQQIQFKNFPGMVFGDNGFGRSSAVSSLSLVGGAGFYSINDQTLPLAAGWPFHFIINKNSAANSAGLTWSSALGIHWKSGAMYETFYDAQTLAWQPLYRVHTNRWFPVSESMVPATGDLLYYDGSNWNRIPKGAANQFLKMNSAGTAPVWSTM